MARGRRSGIALSLAVAAVFLSLAMSTGVPASAAGRSRGHERVGLVEALSGGMNHYYGNLHSHTSYSDGTGTPAEAFAWARDTAGFDFYVITDHAESLTEEEWRDTGVQADAFDRAGEFVALRGFEWSHSVDGHLCVFGTGDFTDAYETSDLDSFYAWIDERDAVAQFNHPARFETHFDGFVFREDVSDNVCLYETGNGPSGNNTGVHLERYPLALDQGWRLAPADNQDNHSLYAYSHRTVVVSPALTRDGILRALRERRVYSSDDPDMEVVFKQGASWMGSVVGGCGDAVRFDVAVEDDEEIVSLELVSAGGAVAAKKEFAEAEDSRAVAWSPEVKVEENAYFYLKVTERDENGDDPLGRGEQVAVTAPIWLEREGTSWCLAEGCTQGGFETWVLVQNPGDAPARVSLTFMTENGPVEGPAAELPARTRL
ncbi:MAG: CehA/McbA family metallohydrolase, partial [Actinobacteria bacterium]|nr:CehA/McbA family metallohydrolase [Actinomycetota bacterium]